VGRKTKGGSLNRQIVLIWIALLTGSTLLLSCGSSATGYIKPRVDFSYLQRAAVLPFENLSRDDLADERMRSVFLTELLDAKILEVTDPRETMAAVLEMGLVPGRSLTPEEAVTLGKKLSVDAVFFGVVEEYAYTNSGRERTPEVTLVLGLTETQTGSIVWRVQVHETGGSFWKRLFGGSPAEFYDVSRRTVQKALETLL